MSNRCWRKQRVPVTSGEWAAITSPGAYDYVAFRCDSSDVLLRSDVEDSTTEDTLHATIQDGISATFNGQAWATLGLARFQPGDIVCYVKSISASATLIVTWVL